MIRYAECLKDRLLDGSIRISEGLFLYCIDSKDAFYFTNKGEMVDFTNNFVRFETQTLFDEQKSLEKGKVYAVNENKTLYNFERYKLQLEEELLDNDFTASLEGGTLKKNGESIAPVTLANSIYHNASELETILDNVNDQIFYKIQVTNKYVEVGKDNQRIFEIPFPFLNYTLGLNQMEIVFNNKVINHKFINLGRMVQLYDDVEENYFKKSDVLLFIFMYNTAISLNDFVVNTNNLEDGSVTNRKLSNDIEIPVDNILTTSDKEFVSEDEKEEWNNKATNSLVDIDNSGLLSNVDYKDFLNTTKKVGQLPVFKTGTCVIPTNETTYTVNDVLIDENSFIVATCNSSDYTVAVAWQFGTMTFTLNTTNIVDVTVNWMIVNPA